MEAGHERIPERLGGPRALKALLVSIAWLPKIGAQPRYLSHGPAAEGPAVRRSVRTSICGRVTSRDSPLGVSVCEER